MNAFRERAARSTSDPVSQRDIARHFGVSHVTVSLALRNSSRVSKSLGDRIRDHAEAVGYRRDPVLFALASYRKRKTSCPVRGAMAWFNAWSEPERLRALPEIERFWLGASGAARDCGFRLEEFRLGSDLSPERLHQVLETRNIRGILLPPHPSGTVWQDFPWDDYAIVSLGRAGGGQRGHQVMPSAAANMTLALRRMKARGYERIGCLGQATLLGRAGYCIEECLPTVQREVAGELPFLDLAGAPEHKTAVLVRAWVRDHRLDAVLADDAATARWLKRAGLSVPGDVAFATLARDGEAGIDPEFEDIGRTAVQMLDELMRETIAGAPRRYRQVAIEGSWRDGASLPQPATMHAV